MRLHSWPRLADGPGSLTASSWCTRSSSSATSPSRRWSGRSGLGDGELGRMAERALRLPHTPKRELLALRPATRLVALGAGAAVAVVLVYMAARESPMFS